MIKIGEISKCIIIAQTAIEFAKAYKTMKSEHRAYLDVRNHFLIMQPHKSFKDLLASDDFTNATNDLYKNYTKSRSKMNKLKIKLINLCTVKE